MLYFLPFRIQVGGLPGLSAGEAIRKIVKRWSLPLCWLNRILDEVAMLDVASIRLIVVDELYMLLACRWVHRSSEVEWSKEAHEVVVE